MPITPTSSISKNYQALGIDEIANDIETAFTSVNALEATVNALPAAPTTTVVNISSAQILAMGTSPIQLLPAAGANNYYDWKLILESTGSDYTLAANLSIDCQPYGNGLVEITPYLITDTVNQTFEINSATQSQPLNQSINLTTVGAVDPTGGTGTIRAIITYTVRTFGA